MGEWAVERIHLSQERPERRRDGLNGAGRRKGRLPASPASAFPVNRLARPRNGLRFTPSETTVVAGFRLGVGESS
jgi:hypothetical protein